MTPLEFFGAAKAYKRTATGDPVAGLTQGEVDALNMIIGSWERAGAPTRPDPLPHSLKDAAAFYKAVRAVSGDLSQPQVDGFNILLGEMGGARWPCSWCAYGLATAYWETARTMQPVKEAYWLSESWRKKNLRYYPWYGRGYVQLTWAANYARADEELDLGGELVLDPDLALKADIAARILVRGMEEGWFTKKALRDYLQIDGEAGHEAFKQARRVINGTDKRVEIAKIAAKFQEALKAGGWG